MNTRTATNRILLALIGLVLLVGGLLALAGGLDLYRRWGLALPGGWPWSNPRGTLLDRAALTGLTDQFWWWLVPTVLLALLALWWLLGRRGQPDLEIPPPGGTTPDGGTTLDGGALADAIADDTARLPDVDRARARITGGARRPRALVAVTLTPRGAPMAVLRRLWSGPLRRAVHSTGWDALPAEARFRVARHRTRRAE
ncbi:alkaline shock response membrane anchor protein AmaP [Thermobifida halotolerans]|uniref:Alkaline shock response membrane anchor protein AmaP n=1 Tax=Thermobifida halotolerans TaxID=483545 RepID=A0A399G8R2_9ACTN|nr:hypothetical protein [Thermobifida halotolerans]UOE20705.1 alkaline shock response membrane anchor protein AmaP [Thermobifida halotolerans]